MTIVHHWDVSADSSGMKLIDFIKAKLNVNTSLRQIKKAIENHQCQVNGRVEHFSSTILGRGDKVCFAIFEKQDSFLAEGPEILYEDVDLLIMNKPSGISSDSELLNKLLEKYGRVELTHRLDKETTGVLIFARNALAFREMLGQFRERKIIKTYEAIVDGIPKGKHGVIDNYLGKKHTYQGQTVWGIVEKKEGLHARTRWSLKQKGKQAALLQCYPETGRTHQIRVHLSGIGHPILGDFQYGRNFRCEYFPGRVLLHALEVNFSHPRSGVTVKVEAPYSQDFIEALTRLFS